MKTIGADPWALYDMLIAGIPPEPRADEIIHCGRRTIVRSGPGVGIAAGFSPAEDAVTRPSSLPERCEGMPLRELAASAKSWNFADAALGVAAMNAWWNSPERPAAAKALAEALAAPPTEGDGSAFEAWAARLAGKKAAVIGHFPHLEQSLGEGCDYCVLEKRPTAGDFPDSACEFLLPQMDVVFITGVALINKTLPRLLALSAGAECVLVGPSVPLCPGLFDWGVRDLQGFVVTDPAQCRALKAACLRQQQQPPPDAKNRRHHVLFQSGRRVSLRR